MDLNEILVFTRVVQAGSFIAAARQLSMPKSTVSRRVSALEARLGARLLQRTTRSLRLTDVGRAYYQHALRVVAEAEEAELAVTHLQEVPRGKLRVTAPLNFHYLGSVVTSFLARYPEMEVELVCSDRVVDLVSEGFDVAVRAGPMADSSLVARRIGVLRSYVVASPAYVERAGAPSSPEDLKDLDGIVFGAGSTGARWTLRREREVRAIDVRARMTANNLDFLVEAVIADLGVAMLPLHLCVSALRSGALQRLLPDWSSPDIVLHAVYPTARHLSPKVNAFLEHLAARMSPSPWEAGPLP